MLGGRGVDVKGHRDIETSRTMSVKSLALAIMNSSPARGTGRYTGSIHPTHQRERPLRLAGAVAFSSMVWGSNIYARTLRAHLLRLEKKPAYCEY